ncbi:MAG: hypothetical protein A3E07_01130 [Candidatus Wildermuthbacteria bacterium RIFCSPHIGHO2_12_FULL_45_9]|uniref:VOC domain-containing protein n=1 Tax=Candidatus Wildermuthbacteria bacterium RIFCSPHIGHO2_02_FULL_45_25 TaxID=1802450 RepID=A0A1G2R007_9BACT|nr:MAG: hypothetical protein A2748_02075 [Candidatus Wildermuthbacteria bacterium RIFCSPHIGHO2_01_FULL_45_20]OHA65709.1 MAG: hypothetical protein A3C04_02220 [Candidatus Wildermuthbacteria bacterium RIFCSPHIGHO2_02_FULL_45_25]OHA70264.1 MAG: hypothetical protein A3E07_01130 [Candidatus Wildermuthbacteria bacterium RIFCSPHIGHO2_12_FULL_45_9]
MLQLNSLLLSSENPKALAEFYGKCLEVKSEWEGGDFVGFRAGSGMLIIGPHDKVKGKNANPERLIFNFETQDVEKEFERIKGLGAQVVAEPYHPEEAKEMTLATFADPDGNYFQLGSPME